MITQLIIKNGEIAAYDENLKKLFSQVKPPFSFDYQNLTFTPTSRYYTIDDIRFEMDDEQINEVQTFVDGISENEELTAILTEKRDAQRYLFVTDWYVTRFAETGKAIPADIQQKRAEAREILSA